MVRVLRWLDCTGEGGKSATMGGPRWRECYVGWSEVAFVLLRLG